MAQPMKRIARNGYRAIVDVLRNEIESGQIKAGHYLPTERELQTRFSASRTTVRKVLLELCEEGWARNLPNKGFVAGRGYRRPVSKRVAFIETGSFILSQIGDDLETRLQAEGYELVRFPRSASHRMDELLQQAFDLGFAGAIVWPYLAFPDQEAIVRASSQLPIVALDHQIDYADTDVITFDYEQIAYDATAHLIEQGARQVAIAGMVDMLEISHLRFRGYMRAMFAHGLEPLAHNFLYTYTSGKNGLHELDLLEHRLGSGDRPDAILILQDFCAAEVVEAVLRVGLEPPTEIRLATIGDDHQIFVDDLELTSVAFDWKWLSEQAFTLLMERLTNLHRPPVCRTARHQLIVKGLSGAPKHLWTPDGPRDEFRLGGPREVHSFQSRPR